MSVIFDSSVGFRRRVPNVTGHEKRQRERTSIVHLWCGGKLLGKRRNMCSSQKNMTFHHFFDFLPARDGLFGDILPNEWISQSIHVCVDSLAVRNSPDKSKKESRQRILEKGAKMVGIAHHLIWMFSPYFFEKSGQMPCSWSTFRRWQPHSIKLPMSAVTTRPRFRHQFENVATELFVWKCERSNDVTWLETARKKFLRVIGEHVV